MQGSTVSKNPSTSVCPPLGPGRSSFRPGSRTGAAEGRRIPNPMVSGMKKSDEAVLPVKAANKGAQAPAEPPEGRASTKGNLRDQSTPRTQGRDGVSQAVERIRQAATRKPQEKLTALLHHITTDALRCAFYDLQKTASAGVDGLVWREYEDGLEERLLDLHERVHSGAYRALPSRRVAIPKPDGGTRPLGIMTPASYCTSCKTASGFSCGLQIREEFRTQVRNAPFVSSSKVIQYGEPWLRRRAVITPRSIQ